jgi:hypothetical protein
MARPHAPSRISRRLPEPRACLLRAIEPKEGSPKATAERRLRVDLTHSPRSPGTAAILRQAVEEHWLIPARWSQLRPKRLACQAAFGGRDCSLRNRVLVGGGANTPQTRSTLSRQSLLNEDTPPAARIGAASAILDRSFGKLPRRLRCLGRKVVQSTTQTFRTPIAPPLCFRCSQRQT